MLEWLPNSHALRNKNRSIIDWRKGCDVINISYYVFATLNGPTIYWNIAIWQCSLFDVFIAANESHDFLFFCSQHKNRTFSRVVEREFFFHKITTLNRNKTRCPICHMQYFIRKMAESNIQRWLQLVQHDHRERKKNLKRKKEKITQFNYL